MKCISFLIVLAGLAGAQITKSLSGTSTITLGSVSISVATISSAVATSTFVQKPISQINDGQIQGPPTATQSTGDLTITKTVFVCGTGLLPQVSIPLSVIGSIPAVVGPIPIPTGFSPVVVALPTTTVLAGIPATNGGARYTTYYPSKSSASQSTSYSSSSATVSVASTVTPTGIQSGSRVSQVGPAQTAATEPATAGASNVNMAYGVLALGLAAALL